MKEQINKLETMTVEKLREVKEQAQQANESITKRLKEQGNDIETNTTSIVFHESMIEDILEKTQTLSHEYKELIRGVIEEEMTTECLTQYEKQISFLNKSRDIVVNERNTTSMSDKESCIIPKEVKYNDYEIITKHQIEQIEEWTNRKVGNILFDSDKDDWKEDTSVFDKRIINKEHIIIIIEDEDGNKFGGYVNSKIDEVESCINDSKSFIFSLKSNGRMKGMMKFDIKQPQHAFNLYNQSHKYLFGFGGGFDILIYKENTKTRSNCNPCSFKCEGISNALCGKLYPNRFTPKRFIVIEMK
ncbi:trichohyalin, putative [Entamoeba histolytica]